MFVAISQNRRSLGQEGSKSVDLNQQNTAGTHWQSMSMKILSVGGSKIVCISLTMTQRPLSIPGQSYPNPMRDFCIS